MFLILLLFFAGNSLLLGKLVGGPATLDFKGVWCPVWVKYFRQFVLSKNRSEFCRLLCDWGQILNLVRGPQFGVVLVF